MIYSTYAWYNIYNNGYPVVEICMVYSTLFTRITCLAYSVVNVAPPRARVVFSTQTELLPNLFSKLSVVVSDEWTV